MIIWSKIWKRYAMADEVFMKAALLEAQKAFDLYEVPVGAVIVKDGNIIGRGHNLIETTKDATAHAEMIAIRDAAKNSGALRLSGCQLYVTTEPCAMCAGAIGWSQAAGVVYGAPDEKKGFTKVKGDLLHPKTIIEKGLLEEECRELLKKFFKSKR